jgi:hypothetical protein
MCTNDMDAYGIYGITFSDARSLRNIRDVNDPHHWDALSATSARLPRMKASRARESEFLLDSLYRAVVATKLHRFQSAPRIVSLELCVYPETKKKDSTSVKCEWATHLARSELNARMNELSAIES